MQKKKLAVETGYEATSRVSVTTSYVLRVSCESPGEVHLAGVKGQPPVYPARGDDHGATAK